MGWMVNGIILIKSNNDESQKISTIIFIGVILWRKCKKKCEISELNNKILR
jgi:hypothetical protein